MDEFIEMKLFNIKYINLSSTYILINNNNTHKIKLIQKKQLFNKINSIEFKIYTSNINSIEFKEKNKNIKITNIHPDGFLISLNFKNINDFIEIFFYPTFNTDSKFFIKKILFNIFEINNLISITWDNIFIINLERRIDRKNNMIMNLNKLKINKYEFINAVDGSNPSIIEKFNDCKINSKTKIITSGHFACLLSHIKAIEIAKNRGYSNIMILEDDVIFCDDFINKINNIKIPQYDMVYLGGIINKKKIFFNNWAKTNKILGAYGYVISSKLFNKVLEELNKFTNYVDLFYMNRIQPYYDVFLLNDFIKTNLDSSDTSNKHKIMVERLSYIK